MDEDGRTGACLSRKYVGPSSAPSSVVLRSSGPYSGRLSYDSHLISSPQAVNDRQ